MSFDLESLQALVAAHGRVARVVVAASAGSVPREVGASMCVWQDGQTGTIGGGALEFDATTTARVALSSGDRFDKISLGADRGQCCGGGVQLLTEIWDAARIADVSDVVARPLPGHSGVAPLKVSKRLRDIRSGTRHARPELLDGWMIEPKTCPKRDIWIWGAGHVGRAIASLLAPMPDFSLTWADSSSGRFPDDVPAGTQLLCAENPAELASLADATAEHLVLTYSHALDLEICHRVLSQPFAALGLIGSATKRSRFRKRLAALGHSQATIDRMDCPIGQPEFGKHPHAIAISVAADLMRTPNHTKLEKRA